MQVHTCIQVKISLQRLKAGSPLDHGLLLLQMGS